MACEEQELRYNDEADALKLTKAGLDTAKAHVVFLEGLLELQRDHTIERIRYSGEMSADKLDKHLETIEKTKDQLQKAREEVTGLKNGIESLERSLKDYEHEWIDCIQRNNYPIN
jgi:peptidoglycan hydrolase CwlO-like protein